MDKTVNSDSKDSPLRRFEWGLFVFVVIAACSAVIAYTIAFAGWQIGNPVDWGAFGDYLGGVLNPIIGIITVLLIVLTLATTRIEAADSRAEMKAQLLHFEKQQVLTDMHRRLEGVLSEWNRLLELPCPRIFVGINANGIRYADDARIKTVRALFENGEIVHNITRYLEQPGHPSSLSDWQVYLFPQIALLHELQNYLAEYEEKAGNTHLTEYYRNRVQHGVEALLAAGVLDEETVSSLLN